ncbi:MAG: hypothetical protein R2744_03230 [Bacteroidales bacterium]
MIGLLTQCWKPMGQLSVTGSPLVSGFHRSSGFIVITVFLRDQPFLQRRIQATSLLLAKVYSADYLRAKMVATLLIFEGRYNLLFLRGAGFCDRMLCGCIRNKFIEEIGPGTMKRATWLMCRLINAAGVAGHLR